MALSGSPQAEFRVKILRTGIICCNRLTGGKRLISGYDL
jgi:hypothetical protein